MDRDTVRIVLLILGFIVIVSVYVWGRYKSRLMDFINRRGDYDELDYGDDAPIEEERESVNDGLNFSSRESEAMIASRRTGPLNTPSFSAHQEDPLIDESIAYGRPQSLHERQEEAFAREAVDEPSRSHAPLGSPFLIQLSVVAGDDAYFNGEALRDALVDQGLIYGDMGIYHRYDREYREVLFSVASLVEPGTFPVEHMETFECPGVVLFFQPPRVKDPLAIFEDLLDTCHRLAQQLGGEEWDERREVLTLKKIEQMRERLESAY
ncbi:cell division protein ZipA [Candidatus Methylospira mobilis]|uniref:Cell division protein ZipA n=1 Tax=Candidatus Methylospira mobilis TaxID=1808979 RepID=A0A5Q0BKA2_9GAMM|nr:cell division protein ZipA [Candidatus Methylospira mobilis]QFY43999.1 cell division protein ZipA [Candidatus Methylospira mobilis]WNV05003.1 cell division protein ZipA [Candidatus Methylospira mobilis]